MLNQILEFHGIVQTQLGRLAALKGFLESQHDELSSDDPAHGDVEMHVDVVQATLQVLQSSRIMHLLVLNKSADSATAACGQSLTRICHELRNAANVLRLPSRRRFPYSSHIDHVRRSLSRG